MSDSPSHRDANGNANPVSRSQERGASEDGRKPDSSPAASSPTEMPDAAESAPITTRLSPVEAPGAEQNAALPMTRTPLQEWSSWKISAGWMSTVILTEFVLIAAIIAIERISASRNGFATVPQISFYADSHSLVSDIWRYGLLWTALPSFIMTLYNAVMWGTIVSGTADRQPFIELRRKPNKRANAAITIMLDYRSYPPFYNWAVACFWKGHYLIGFAMFLSLLFSIGVIPLASHLFIAAPSVISSSIPITLPTTFYGSAFTNRSTLLPAIDLASAIRTYGGNAPPWMSTEYAFEQFSSDKGQLSGNITLSITAYSAYLDCQTYSANNTTIYDDNFLTVKIVDRGCKVADKVFPVDNSTQIYLVSWNSDCTNSDTGRIAMFSGEYSEESPIKIANPSVISCVPSYWNTTGLLTASIQPNIPPQNLSFTPGNTTKIHPELYQTLEDTLNYYSFVDQSNIYEANAFSLASYNYAISQNSAALTMPQLMQNSMTQIFNTMYAGLTKTLLIQQASTARTSTAAFSAPVTRLFVVTPIAYTIASVLAAILVCNIMLFIYAKKHNSILVEEPIGLLGNAALLHGSDVSKTFIPGFQRDHGDIRNMRDFIKDNYDVKGSECWFDEDEGRIRLQKLKQLETPRLGFWRRFGFWFKRVFCCCCGSGGVRK